jgi:hypothetical protein
MMQARADREANTELRQLRLLSFNIQGGSATQRYRHYVTRGLQNVLPHPHKRRNLMRVAEVAEHFDLVALNEGRRRVLAARAS